MIRVFGMLAGILCTVLYPVSAVQTNPSIDKMAWMAGCWEGKMGSGKTQEQWMRPEGNSMLGMSRTVVAGNPARIVREF